MPTRLRPILLCILLFAFAITSTRPILSTPLASDVLPDYHNKEVTALCEDMETLRLALGVAWDDAQACRSMSGYLRSWAKDDSRDAAEDLLKRGAAMYELVKCVDDGVESVRLARDSRDAPRLPEDIRFWRNELSLAATKTLDYAAATAALKTKLTDQLNALAKQKGLSAVQIPQMPWADPQREAWRKAGPATGVRLTVDPLPQSFPAWWNNTLSVNPYYIATKLASTGDRFFTPEMAIGAWGYNCVGPGKYDFSKLNGYLEDFKKRQLGLMLELPTLQESKTPDQDAADISAVIKTSWPVMDRYAPALPAYLASDENASLVALNPDGTTRLHGAVQLFNPDVAKAYGQYLMALAADLKARGFYDTIAAIHMERGDSNILPESVDYSSYAQTRWAAFLKEQYPALAAIEGISSKIPVRTLIPRAKDDWDAFLKTDPKLDPNADPKGTANGWGRYLQKKFKTPEATRAALGDDFKDGYDWRLPFDYYPGRPEVKIAYLQFRRQWVQDYMAIKRDLAQKAFPDKLIITETRQFGDHDGVAGKGEEKWGGFINDDLAQWSGVGPFNETRPFMIRSVGPVGFGSRLSDSLESLYRDYLGINFREAGNLARYFYDWVAQGYMDYQLGWQSITNHYLTNRLLYQIGPTVANTAPERQPIGLLLPRATYDLEDGSVYYGFLGWDWMLNAAKLPYTRVDERFIRDGRLKEMGLKVLIVPEAKAMDSKVAAAIAQWVADGGTLVADTVPQQEDEYGQPVADSPFKAVLGAVDNGTVSEAIKDSPLTVTIPHGFYSGMWQTTTDRKPPFETLSPTTATVLASYEGGKPAITSNQYGKGRAVTLGYPFGTEAVQMEETSIGFYRTYVYFAREPQLVARTAWLRKFFTDMLAFQPEYGVDYADVGRFHGQEAINPSFNAPKGVQTNPDDLFYVATFGDPRPDHQLEIAHETPDMAIRFYPRSRTGLATHYLGISTREVHYMGPRADVQMHLAPHLYHCRINNPKIQAIWDTARDVPVGFERDDRGVSFNVSLPSGHIMMLAVSETPVVQLFDPAPFPGRQPTEILARVKRLAGGKRPPMVADLTPTEILPWLKHLAVPPPPAAGSKIPTVKPHVYISYGQEANKPAADKLATLLRDKLDIDAEAVEQLTTVGTNYWGATPTGYEKALIFIGDEWTNNDMALHGAYWGISYGPQMPFTATYAWPGLGRAVISLSRPYALLDDKGKNCSYRFNLSYKIRPVEDSYLLFRRKLHIAANGDDAMAAVDEIIQLVDKGTR